MKKTTIFSSALVALAMLASCQKEELFETPATTTGVTEFTATIEQQTRTAIASDGKVTWVTGDEITVTDAARKSAIYVAESAGATTTFTLKSGQTPVGDGPYTATYGDIAKQVYDAAGANCPLTAAKTSTTNFHFSSPYAVVKVTAKSSGGELVKTVVVKYGNSSFILDCGEGVTLTSDGKVFYVAVLPSTDAALSIIFYTADKMATRTRKSGVSLAANDLLPVTFESLDWSAQKTFKAVYDTKGGANTLTFYYDNVDHSGDGITIYQGSTDTETTKYLFDGSQTSGAKKWGYNDNRSKTKSIVINPSVADYPFLTSTAYMFYAMSQANSISGAEYLDVSNVTDMSYMFCAYGQNSTELINVPDVSKWNTGKVTDMSAMFSNYGKNSSGLTEVPNVKDWITENVENMSSMFSFYGYSPTSFNEVPDVSGWNTDKVTNMSGMFQSYGYSSTSFNKVPDVSGWETGKVNNMINMFNAYGKQSNALAAVPVVSGWGTDNVTNMSNMFRDYGYTSNALAAVPDVSKWDTGKVTDWGEIFRNYGYSSTALNTVPDVSGWKTGNVTDIANMFDGYGSSSSNIDCVLDLSGWDLSNVKTESKAFDFHPKTFNVTIPAKTGDKVNEAGKWYCGSNSDIQTSKSVVPAFKPGSTTERYSFIPVLTGVFSVSATKKVHFSQGNLWYGKVGSATTETWNFEPNQYEIQASWNTSHVSHFYWSKTASVAYAEPYSESGTTSSDVFFTNAEAETAKTDFTVNGVTGKYRTLSTDEWTYLFNTRTMANGGAGYENLTLSGITVQGVVFKGVVLFPDNFTEQEIWKTKYTTWEALNSAGLVFLPAAGGRSGSNVFNVGGDGNYWSSSAFYESFAYSVSFNDREVNTDCLSTRSYFGFSVRLVMDVPAK